MGKTQINFRIDEELLTAIKKEAKKHGKTHTEWIIECCRERLGMQSLTLETLSEKWDLQQIAIESLNQKLTAIENQLKPPPMEKSDQTNCDHTPEKGLTHAELSRQLGVSSSTVSRWSTGKRHTPEDLNYYYDQEIKRWRLKDE